MTRQEFKEINEKAMKVYEKKKKEPKVSKVAKVNSQGVTLHSFFKSQEGQKSGSDNTKDSANGGSQSGNNPTIALIQKKIKERANPGFKIKSNSQSQNQTLSQCEGDKIL